MIPRGNYSITAQFNPRRTANSTAAVDEESIRLRPCFLCTTISRLNSRLCFTAENICFYAIRTIFDHQFHYCLSKHKPQEITSSLNRLLQLAWDLSPGYQPSFTTVGLRGISPRSFAFFRPVRRKIFLF